MQALETAAQQPLTMGAALGQQSAQAGFNVGQLGLKGAGQSVALATGNAATTNPYSTLLSGVAASPVFGQVVNSAANSLDQYLYPSGNPLQTGIYSDPGLWT
jgi:hypothetical protein